jgi:hypothetical protein
MKEVVTLKKQLHISTRIPLDGQLSIGEFFSLMEDSCKKEFFNEIVSRIKFNKQYLFKVKVIDAESDSWYNKYYMDMGIMQETFEFTMYELDDDEVVTKPETVCIRGLF